MANLTEREILSCLRENLRIAAEKSQDLADGKRGLTYLEFRRSMKLIDGCCRQMAGWREDLRWSPFGVQVQQAQVRAGKWLREDKKNWRPKFLMLADIMRAAIVRAEELETKKTGRSGIILPKPLAPPTRTQGRQILVPSGYQDIRNAEKGRLN